MNIITEPTHTNFSGVTGLLVGIFVALHGLGLLSQYYHYQLDQIMLTDEDNNTFSVH